MSREFGGRANYLLFSLVGNEILCSGNLTTFGSEKLVSWTCTFLEQYKLQPLPKEIQYKQGPESASCHNLAICRPWWPMKVHLRNPWQGKEKLTCTPMFLFSPWKRARDYYTMERNCHLSPPRNFARELRAR